MCLGILRKTCLPLPAMIIVSNCTGDNHNVNVNNHDDDYHNVHYHDDDVDDNDVI